MSDDLERLRAEGNEALAKHEARTRKPARAAYLVDVPELEGDGVDVLGRVHSVAYTGTLSGDGPHLYEHRFEPDAAPLLGADSANGQLFFIGGNYTTSSRGIIDANARGYPDGFEGEQVNPRRQNPDEWKAAVLLPSQTWAEISAVLEVFLDQSENEVDRHGGRQAVLNQVEAYPDMPNYVWHADALSILLDAIAGGIMAGPSANPRPNSWSPRGFAKEIASKVPMRVAAQLRTNKRAPALAEIARIVANEDRKQGGMLTPTQVESIALRVAEQLAVVPNPPATVVHRAVDVIDGKTVAQLEIYTGVPHPQAPFSEKQYVVSVYHPDGEVYRYAAGSNYDDAMGWWSKVLAEAASHGMGFREVDPNEAPASNPRLLPMAPDNRKWNAAAAKKRVKKWATTGKTVDWDKYARAFMYRDPKKRDVGYGFKLPFADVIKGELYAVPRAIEAIHGVLDGARGGVDIPRPAKDKAKRLVVAYYRKMGKPFSGWGKR